MKHNDVNPTYPISVQNLENIFNVYQDKDEYYFYNILRTVYFPKDLDPSSYTIYLTVPKDTWPLISFKHYNTVKLWWVICSANQINNPVVQPTPGLPIKIINSSIVSNILTTITTS